MVPVLCVLLALCVVSRSQNTYTYTIFSAKPLTKLVIVEQEVASPATQHVTTYTDVVGGVAGVPYTIERNLPYEVDKVLIGGVLADAPEVLVLLVDKTWADSNGGKAWDTLFPPGYNFASAHALLNLLYQTPPDAGAASFIFSFLSAAGGAAFSPDAPTTLLSFTPVVPPAGFSFLTSRIASASSSGGSDDFDIITRDVSDGSTWSTAGGEGPIEWIDIDLLSTKNIGFISYYGTEPYTVTIFDDFGNVVVEYDKSQLLEFTAAGFLYLYFTADEVVAGRFVRLSTDGGPVIIGPFS